MSVENGTLKLGSLQLGGGTSKTLAEVNPLLRRREILIETDTNKLKIGDGNSRWNDLPYVGFASSESSGTQISSLAVPTVVLGLENAPVAIPAYGDIYIVGNTPTGAFSGATANSIAIYGENGWEFSTPTVGTKVVNIRAGKILQYNGTSWEHIASITVTNDAKCLHSLTISDSLSTIPYIGDDWDLSTLSATAQYSTGFGNPVNSALSTPIDSSQCSFWINDGTRQIQTGQVIDVSGSCNILVKYTNSGRTATGTVSRYIRAIDSTFLSYFNTITDGSNIVLQSFNADYYNANPTSDLAVLSKTFIDGEKKNIVLSNTLFKGSTSHSVITGNLAFPNASYLSDGTLRNWFTGMSGFNANIQFPNNAQIEFDYMFYNAAYNKPVTIPNGVTNCAYAFGGSRSTFNQPVNIPNGVTDCSHMFANSSSFNSSVNIPDSVMDMSYMYYSASNFNKPITIPNNAQNCANMFYATNFNQDIYIPNSVNNVYGIVGSGYFNSNVQIGSNVKNYSGLFYHSGFNKPFTIPNGVTDCSNMFASSQFNQNISIPDSVTNINWMFSSCDIHATIHIGNGIRCNGTSSTWYNAIPKWDFNCAVDMADGITNCYQMFYNKQYFNAPIKISNNAVNCAQMFYNAMYFNQPITIPNTVKDCSQMFGETRGYRQNTYIPDSVTNIQNMFIFAYNFTKSGATLHIGNGVQLTNGKLFDYAFYGTQKDQFNCSIELGEGITNCSEMFLGCRNLNSPIKMGNNVTNCANMFSGCYNFNQPINILGKGIDCANMFSDCYNFNQPVNILGNARSCYKMFNNCPKFNKPVYIADGVTNCEEMFSSDSIFNCNITFPNSIISICTMPTNFAAHIFIGAGMSFKSIDYLLYRKRNTTPNVVVHCSNLAVLSSTSGYTITGRDITWASGIPNTFSMYNSEYGIIITNK